jgi:hypothetical protein
LKLVCIALITVVLSVDCMGVTLRPRTDDQQLTDTDLQEARQLAIEFTTRFLRTTDLSLLVKDLFVKDFIERYKEAKSKDLIVTPSPSVYFVPGLDYNSRLLAEAGPENWLRFYTAANNFVFFGIMSGIKNSKNAANISANEMYPSSVIELLNTNPSLENMIVRKGKSKPVSSVEEMQKATATLEQAVSIMQQKAKGQSPLNINEKELIKAMEEDEFFRPTLKNVDDQHFGLPKGTRVVFINTPILFRLMLVKTNSTKLEILWADPYTGG